MKRKSKFVKLSLIVLLLLSASMALPQFEPETQPLPGRLESSPLPTSDSIFQRTPQEYYIKITAFKTFSIIIIVLAFLLGLVSYYVGLSAGGDINKKEIRKAILSALVIAIFARPISILAHQYLGIGLSYILPENYAYGFAGFITYVLWNAYLLAIPVYLYESFTVTAKEAYPAGRR